MKGLIAKDSALILIRKRSLLIILACVVLMCFTMEPSFIVGWMSFIGAFYSISTISFDEHDNCFPFLMTLPISRKGYAVEKYVFGAICAAMFWFCGAVMFFAALVFRGIGIDPATDIPLVLIDFLLPILMIDFTIPFNLKYGTEKSRIYLFVFCGVLAALVIVLVKYVLPGADIDMASMPVSMYAVAGIAFVLVLILTAISIAISIRVMSAKEF